MAIVLVLSVAALVWLIATLLWQVYLGLTGHLLPRYCSFNFATQFGPWAVVTGCTDGIGKAYAKELAKRGLNIVLISRNEDKLLAVSNEIEREFHVSTKIITADFSKGQIIFNKIKSEINNIPIGILVNNVGKQYTFPTYLGEVNEQELWDIININIGATTMMTRMVLNEMVQRNKGAIVNISSSAELQPLPLMTVYAATKTFIKNFSEALRFEYNQEGIIIQHLSPFYVSTKMNAFSHRFDQSNLFVPSAETYARNAVNTLGFMKNSTGYWAHGIQYYFATLPPVWVRKYIGGFINQILRKDYISKKRENCNVP